MYGKEIGSIEDIEVENGYVFEHRLMMEQSLGRNLKSTEIIHHVDSDRGNNNLNNLMLLKSHAEHRKAHYNMKKTSGGAPRIRFYRQSEASGRDKIEVK